MEQILLQQKSVDANKQQNISSTDVIGKKVPVVAESNPISSSSNELAILNERLKKLEKEKEDLANTNNVLQLNQTLMSNSNQQPNVFNNSNNMMQMNNNGNNMIQLLCNNQTAPQMMMFGNGFNQTFPQMMMFNNNSNNNQNLQERNKKHSSGSG